MISNPDISYALKISLPTAIQITKNHISLVLTDLTGKILKYEYIFLLYMEEDNYYYEVNKRLENLLNEGECNKQSVLGIGISFPGIINLDKELITNSHILD